MTDDSRARFEAWFTEFRRELGDIRKAGAAPYTVALRSWIAATAAEREQREGEPLIDFKLRTDDEYRRAFISELHEQVTAERERGEARVEAIEAATIERCLATVPSNWCDVLLTGPDAPKGAWGCSDIERLLRAIRAALRALGEK